ncbi:hypothetical protein AK88_04876 [Plasmodium fragile]|uniref:Uncharacterized protein n=1 Tax=Plasmodium fragile TaxID=5857 RepID=A0A0D9QEJ2_PLAFR|nr:uncharacterized protein AK88_04876 [Plasmodium fragile]KJP85480.1 hypothetical protein AK88_04876 [Plasmodium fragile]
MQIFKNRYLCEYILNRRDLKLKGRNGGSREAKKRRREKEEKGKVGISKRKIAIKKSGSKHSRL